MPVIDSNGCAIDAEITGPAERAGADAVEFARHHAAMWDPQMDAFTKKYRVLRYDRRGHGKSGVPKGPYSMEMLGRDAIARAGRARHPEGATGSACRWAAWKACGLAPMPADRFDKIILSNPPRIMPTSHLGRPHRSGRARAARSRRSSGMVVNAWLTKDFRERAPDTTARMKEMMIATPVEGYLGCCEAVRDMDHREIYQRHQGADAGHRRPEDPATTVAAGEFIRRQHSGREARHRRRRAYRQCRSAGRLYQDGARLPRIAI